MIWADISAGFQRVNRRLQNVYVWIECNRKRIFWCNDVKRNAKRKATSSLSKVK